MSSYSSPLVCSSCDNKNNNNKKNVFRAGLASHEGPLLSNTASHSTTAASSANAMMMMVVRRGSYYEERSDDCQHYRSDSKDSYVSMMMMQQGGNGSDDDDDDIILEQSTPTFILPADNQLLSAWSFFASRYPRSHPVARPCPRQYHVFPVLLQVNPGFVCEQQSNHPKIYHYHGYSYRHTRTIVSRKKANALSVR